MVSLQNGLFPWFDYELELPDTDQYLPPYLPDPSYKIPKMYLDTNVLEQLPRFFSRLYQTHPKMFSRDARYSLFVPLQTPLLWEAYQILSEPGYSHAKKLADMESISAIERTLGNHMIAYRIEPTVLYRQDVTLETLNGIVFVDKTGFVNRDSRNKIEYCKVFENATLFFITREIV